MAMVEAVCFVKHFLVLAHMPVPRLVCEVPYAYRALGTLR